MYEKGYGRCEAHLPEDTGSGTNDCCDGTRSRPKTKNVSKSDDPHRLERTDRLFARDVDADHLGFCDIHRLTTAPWRMNVMVTARPSAQKTSSQFLSFSISTACIYVYPSMVSSSTSKS